MCMIADEDYWTWYEERHVPRARKEHTCGECRRTIARGESYWIQGGVNDGTFVWNKTCDHCNEASDWLLYVCDGWVFGARLEDFMEHVVGYERYIRSRPLVRLVRWMRAGWRDREGNLRSVESVTVLTEVAINAYKDQRAA